MNIIKYFHEWPFDGRVAALPELRTIAKEVMPFKTFMIEVDGFVVAQALSLRPSRLRADRCGNLWMDGEDDVIPTDYLENVLAAAGVDNTVGAIIINARQPMIYVVAIPSRDDHRELAERHAHNCGGLEEFELCEPCAELKLVDGKPAVVKTMW